IIDSDDVTLKSSKIYEKIRVGYQLAKGQSCDLNTILGKACIFVHKRKVKNLLKDIDNMIIVTSLGGGIGSGGTVALLQIAKEQNIKTKVVCSTPFEFESKIRKSNARNAFLEIRKLTCEAIMAKIKVTEPQSINQLFDSLDDVMMRLVLDELNRC
ncbi:hypothetical protein HDR58_03035, partial [bacterium]|nr:hypothetical protein [bacterium]